MKNTCTFCTSCGKKRSKTKRANRQQPDEKWRSLCAGAVGFLAGQAMRASRGEANPKRAREILMERLDKGW